MGCSQSTLLQKDIEALKEQNARTEAALKALQERHLELEKVHKGKLEELNMTLQASESLQKEMDELETAKRELEKKAREQEKQLRETQLQQVKLSFDTEQNRSGSVAPAIAGPVRTVNPSMPKRANISLESILGTVRKMDNASKELKESLTIPHLPKPSPPQSSSSSPAVSPVMTQISAPNDVDKSFLWRRQFDLPEDAEMLGEWRVKSSAHANKPGMLSVTKDFLLFAPPAPDRAMKIAWGAVEQYRKVDGKLRKDVIEFRITDGQTHRFSFGDNRDAAMKVLLPIAGLPQREIASGSRPVSPSGSRAVSPSGSRAVSPSGSHISQTSF